MANRRMFSKQITASDAFVDMPASSQLLYFHLNMEADDDGFVSNPKRIIKMLNVADDDLKILLAKRFLLAFESGVVVIKHWLLHNAVRKDMYKETQYLDEKKTLQIKDNNVYTDGRNETVTKPLHRIGKDRIGKISLEEERAEKTPKEESNKFFEMISRNEQEYFDFLDNFSDKTKIDKGILNREVKNFVNYWSEKTQGGTKMRWETEKTFEIQRRLSKWFGNASKWSQEKKLLKTKQFIV